MQIKHPNIPFMVCSMSNYKAKSMTSQVDIVNTRTIPSWCKCDLFFLLFHLARHSPVGS